MEFIMKKNLGLSILYLILSSSFVSANEGTALFEKAYKNAVLSSYQNWAITQTSAEDEETRVERIDFSKTGDARWQLISIDGKAPSKGKIKKFLKQKRKEAKAEAKQRAKNSQDDSVQYLLNRSIIPLVKPNTVTLVSQDNTNSIFHFRPLMTSAEEKEMEKSLYGELTIQNATESIVKVRLFNKETFSVEGAKLSQFNQAISFTPTGSNHQTFLKSIQITMKGKAMGLFSLDQTSTITFSDYLQTTP